MLYPNRLHGDIDGLSAKAASSIADGFFHAKNAQPKILLHSPLPKLGFLGKAAAVPKEGIEPKHAPKQKSITQQGFKALPKAHNLATTIQEKIDFLENDQEGKSFAPRFQAHLAALKVHYESLQRLLKEAPVDEAIQSM